MIFAALNAVTYGAACQPMHAVTLGMILGAVLPAGLVALAVANLRGGPVTRPYLVDPDVIAADALGALCDAHGGCEALQEVWACRCWLSIIRDRREGA